MSEPLHMFVEPELPGSTAVLAFEGWNDAGEAATSAIRYLNDSIEAVPLAEIDPENFYDFTVCRPEIAITVEGGRHIRWPSNGFRYGSADATREVVTCLGVEPHFRWRSFCECVIEVCRRTQVERIVMVGSFLADVIYSQPVQVTGYSSDPADLSPLERLGVADSNYQGPTGIVGVLTEDFRREGFEVLSLWACLPHYIDVGPNPRGALALVQKLVQVLDLRIDLEPLRKGAAEFEERISRLVAADPELSDYVKQLKRREFAQ